MNTIKLFLCYHLFMNESYKSGWSNQNYESKYMKPGPSQSTLHVANNFMLEPIILSSCTMCRMQPIKDILNKMYFIWLDAFRAKFYKLSLYALISYIYTSIICYDIVCLL